MTVEQPQPGDVYLTDAGDGQRFVRIVTTLEGDLANCVTMQFGTTGNLFTISPNEIFSNYVYDELGWKTVKLSPPDGFVMSTYVLPQELSGAIF